jgi:hypothetical protein
VVGIFIALLCRPYAYQQPTTCRPPKPELDKKDKIITQKTNTKKKALLPPKATELSNNRKIKQ